jgi:hypothetical protein
MNKKNMFVVSNNNFLEKVRRMIKFAEKNGKIKALLHLIKKINNTTIK